MIEEIMVAFLVDMGLLDITMRVDETLSYRSSNMLMSWLNIDGESRGIDCRIPTLTL